MKKYELTAESKINWFGKTLYRIKACIDFTTTSGDKVKAGDLGGYVEKEQNLSHDGKAWVCGDAMVCDNAMVWGNAKVYGDAKVCGDAKVWGNAKVYGDAKVCGDAEVWGKAEVCGDAMLWGNAKVYGDAKVCGDAKVWGNAEVWGKAEVCGDAEVWGNASIFSTKHIFCVTPIGQYANSLTLFRTKHLEIKISFECELYSVEEFKKVIDEWGDTKNREVALAVLEIGQKHINFTPAKSFEDCPFCGGKAELDEAPEVVICTECSSTAKKEIWNNRCGD